MLQYTYRSCGLPDSSEPKKYVLDSVTNTLWGLAPPRGMRDIMFGQIILKSHSKHSNMVDHIVHNHASSIDTQCHSVPLSATQCHSVPVDCSSELVRALAAIASSLGNGDKMNLLAYLLLTNCVWL